MKRLILLIVLLSIAVTTSISAEEIRLTTIVPDQTVMKAKRGAIGETYSAIADGSIPTSALLVEGNVGIGTKIPAAKLEVSGGSMILAPTGQPASGTEKPGMIYYDSTAKTMYYWNESDWIPMGGGGGGAFGLTTALDSGTFYKADTDCLVWAHVSGGYPLIEGWASDPAGSGSSTSFRMVAQARINVPTPPPQYYFLMFPVRKNDYWRVTKTGVGFCYVWMMPVGN